MVFLVIGGLAIIIISILFFAGRKRKTAEVDFYNSILPMWIFDRETLKFLAVNNAAIKLYGYTEEEFLQKTIKDIRLDWEVGKLESHLTRQPLTGKNSGIWKHRKKNGDVMLVRVTADDTMHKGKLQRLITVEDISHTLTAHR